MVATAGADHDRSRPVPKIGAIVAAIPPPVLGGAASCMFGTVAVIGIQTLRRVDFHDDRNVVVVAVWLGLALIPVGLPDLLPALRRACRPIVGSGITMGACRRSSSTWCSTCGAARQPVAEVVPPRSDAKMLTIDEVNALIDEEFVADVRRRCSRARRGSPRRLARAPVRRVYELRQAFHDVLFDAPASEQLELIAPTRDIAASSRGEPRPSAAARPVLGRPGPADADEYERFDALNQAYRAEVRLPVPDLRAREHEGDDPAGRSSAGWTTRRARSRRRRWSRSPRSPTCGCSTWSRSPTMPQPDRHARSGPRAWGPAMGTGRCLRGARRLGARVVRRSASSPSARTSIRRRRGAPAATATSSPPA